MRKILFVIFILHFPFSILHLSAASKYDNPDTIVVSRDGTGEFRTVAEAVEVCRAFMDYHKVIYVKNGVYKEKIIVPSWLTNIEICGESAEKTIIAYDDHANIAYQASPATTMVPHPASLNSKPSTIGTFRTYTMRIDGSYIILKNITVENNAPKLGQAVALHTQGTHLLFLGCRFLGNQDTVYTGAAGAWLYFKDCLIEGTVDFIFGPSMAWFENCTIFSRADGYVSAASTPKDQKYGYIFDHCKLIAEPGVTKVYLGRPWRQYAHTLFMNCELGSHIVPAGWLDWKKDHNCIRYAEYNNTGAGADIRQRADWTHQLTKKEVQQIKADFSALTTTMIQH